MAYSCPDDDSSSCPEPSRLGREKAESCRPEGWGAVDESASDGGGAVAEGSQIPTAREMWERARAAAARVSWERDWR